MDPLIRSYIQQAQDPKKATHFYGATKSYLSVPIDAQQSFWLTYCDTVSQNQNPCVCELVGNKNALQLAYDIKLSFERQQIPSRQDVILELIDSIDEYIQHIIGVIQVMMNNYFEISEQGSEYVACYLRRDEKSLLIWNNDTVEYVARIIFPYARINKQYTRTFHHFIINQLQISGDNPYEHLSIPPINGIDTLFQPSNSEMIEMYGSSLNDDIPPLKLYEIYGVLNTDVKTTFDLTKVFAPALHTLVSQDIITRDMIMMKIMEKGLQFWLPLFFSAGFYDFPLNTREGISLISNEAPKITMTVIKESGESLDKLERARQLLTYLSITRADHYWSWIDIGQALRSIDPGEEGLRLWKWFTGQRDFKDANDCEMLWSTFNGEEGVDIETLEYFVSIDNPSAYEIFREREVREALNKAIHQQEHTQVAKAFKACFPHNFVCSNYDKAEWYHYNNHRWVNSDGDAELMWYINEKFQSKLEHLRAEIATSIARSRDVQFKSENESFINSISLLIAKLSKNGFKKSLCDELKIYYRKSNFNSIKDMNPDYTATPSGVIDLRGGSPVVRHGKPQDYITKSTRYPYPFNYTWESPAVKMVTNYLKQVFRSKSLLDYVYRLLGSLLKSGNNDKIFPILSGQGNNSKSIFVALIEAALGSYAVKLPTSLITEKRTSADSATPTLIHAAGAKVAFLQEPNPKDVIQSGTVKELTGGVDTVYVRDLFQKGSKIVEMFITVVIILICNKIPVIPDCQEAIWNRTRVVEFLSKWSAQAPSDPEEQFKLGIFKMDKFFDRQIPIMAPALLWIMVQKYEEYYNEGLNDPPEVLQATENFRVNNNIYIHFTRDCVKQVLTPTGEVDQTVVVHLDELYNSFKHWYTKDQQFRGKVPTKTEFKENIEIVWKSKADENNRWYGLRPNTQANTIASLLSF